MNIIRFYDDTNVIINQIPLRNLLEGQYEMWEVEYCTYESGQKIRKVWRRGESNVKECADWVIDEENKYYVFLDTRWEGEVDIPDDVRNQLTDMAIKKVYVYTRFDESAAEELRARLEMNGVSVCGVEKIYISKPIDSLMVIKNMLDVMHNGEMKQEDE